MYLHDIMRVCLLALDVRYPEHSVDIDTQVCNLPGIPERGWTATQVLELLAQKAPQLLIEPASLYINGHCCAIFFSGHSNKDRPAILIHCRGKIPVKQCDIFSLYEKMVRSLPILLRPPHKMIKPT